MKKKKKKKYKKKKTFLNCFHILLHNTPKGPLPRLPLPPTVLQEQPTVHWCALWVAHCSTAVAAAPP